MFPTEGPAEDEATTGADAEETEATEGESSNGDDLQKLREENEYYVQQLQRARADLDNYRRRVQRDQAQDRRRITIGLIRGMLPVHDDLLLAARADEADGSHEQLRDGLQLILEKFDRVLQDAHVKAIATVGESFDPNLHEAMFQEETTDAPDGEILEEFERGYLLGEDLLRPARVKVAKAPAEEG